MEVDLFAPEHPLIKYHPNPSVILIVLRNAIIIQLTLIFERMVIDQEVLVSNYANLP